MGKTVFIEGSESLLLPRHKCVMIYYYYSKAGFSQWHLNQDFKLLTRIKPLPIYFPSQYQPTVEGIPLVLVWQNTFNTCFADYFGLNISLFLT